MKRRFALGGMALVVVLLLVVGGGASGMLVGQSLEAVPSVESQQALVDQYCAYCHNDTTRSGGFSWADVDLAHPELSAARVEEIIRKLRVGQMPPAGAGRPEPTVLKDFAGALETRVDQAAAQSPFTRPPDLHRLNRTEYRNSIRDLLGLTVDVSALLPPDARTNGFDNMADALTVTPALINAYLRAAGKISRQAVGDPEASAAQVYYKVPKIVNQMRRVEGAPFGTRGGISVVHNFLADGDYSFKLELYYYYTGAQIGSKLPTPLQDQQLEVSVDGERVAVFTIDPDASETDNVLISESVYIKAGQRRLAAAFVSKHDGPVEDQYQLYEHTLLDVSIANQSGMTALPHLQTIAVTGPMNSTGVSETDSRRRIFTCRPAERSEEEECAEEIISRLAGQAFRRPPTPEDLEGLMIHYEDGYVDGGFEAGVRVALQGILSKPEFVFRFEQVPDGAAPGANYPISDLELASRLSYFLWSSIPDEELVNIASEGRLRDPATLEQQVKRMLADPRSDALATSFAGQWLGLQGIRDVLPEPGLFPNYTRNLGESMRREVELLFDSILREDRSPVELLAADYTFVDEVLAEHYGIPNVVGPRFKRVQLSDPNRFGLIGKAGLLTMTSLANRTSPVARGKYVLEVLLGTPPPSPPPVVPPLAEAVDNQKVLRVRDRMEQHRASPACSGCHQIMDPIGLALENFDAVGVWRANDSGFPIDPSGRMFDGMDLDGPAGVRQALLDRTDSFLRGFTESLLAYGLGRVTDHRDMPTVRAIMREAAGNDNRSSSFVLGIVKSAPFQMSRLPEISERQD